MCVNRYSKAKWTALWTWNWRY